MHVCSYMIVAQLCFTTVIIAQFSTICRVPKVKKTRSQICLERKQPTSSLSFYYPRHIYKILLLNPLTDHERRDLRTLSMYTCLQFCKTLDSINFCSIWLYFSHKCILAFKSGRLPEIIEQGFATNCFKTRCPVKISLTVVDTVNL